jgi:glycosyltransferase involved in cell wall biosynthesis
MKKVLLIDSSYPINTRNEKIITSLKEYEIHVIAWNRDNRAHKPVNEYIEHIYYSRAPYGKPFIKFFKLIFYFFFIKSVTKKIDPDFIIASHWDMLMLAVLIKLRSCKLIYENLDIPTANSKIFLTILKQIEKQALRKTEAIIVASRFYVPIYNYYNRSLYVLENKPCKNILAEKTPAYSHVNNNRIVLSFVGTLRYFDCMQRLIIASDRLVIDILFFGDGPDYLKLKEFSKNSVNVYFYGRYKYADIKCIYDLSDIIWAVYPNKDYNVKYAISNKFFESLVFKKPGIYADKTLLGDFVLENNMGLIVDPYDEDDIRGKLVDVIKNQNILTDIKKSMENFNKKNSLYWEDDADIFKKIFC